MGQQQNAPNPHSMTVKQLMEILATQQPDAIVLWEDPWNSSLVILHNVKVMRADGGVVVKLSCPDFEEFLQDFNEKFEKSNDE